MDNRKNWTQQQDQLRKRLSAKAHFEEAIQLFKQQFSAVHTASVSPGKSWSLEDEVLAGLTDSQVKAVPRPGENSIVWLLWHTARIEDMTMSCLVFEQSQVIQDPAWKERLALSSWDCGASMDEDEVARFSAQVSVQGLRDYRTAVGRNTLRGIARLCTEQIKEVVSADAIQQFRREGSISDKGSWLADYYTGRTKGFFLTRTATSHNFIHLNEAGRIRASIVKGDVR